MKVRVKIVTKETEEIMEVVKELLKQYLTEVVRKSKHYVRSPEITAETILERRMRVLGNKIILKFSLIDKDQSSKIVVAKDFAEWLVEKVSHSEDSFYKTSTIIRLAKWLQKVKSEDPYDIFLRKAIKVIKSRPFRGSNVYLKQCDIGEELYMKMNVKLGKSKNVQRIGVNRYRVKLPNKVSLRFI